MPRHLTLAVEHFAIAGRFVISRGARTEAVVVTATITDGDHRGRGECVPYARYGESVEGVVATIESQRVAIAGGLDRTGLQEVLPAGAARNALDCALWDLEAKITGVPAHVLAGIARVPRTTTAYTISLGTPEAMGYAAQRSRRPILKIKLGGAGDPARIAAVRAAAPDAVIIADANEAWTPDMLADNLAACDRAAVALVEQPLPAGDDQHLAAHRGLIPFGADESLHTRDDLDRLAGLYDVVNVKLDKTGGLTEAFALIADAEARGLGIMVGCMVGTSLAMAPAMLLTPRARFVDLDGPLLLAEDRPDGLLYEGSVVSPPTPALWG
ncbi:N-acetyl-D-Glu racemase DgcA [Chelatococcus asaccharovorans]|uniref:Dipeptide epimerase n=1 Tax=Chelatococcus asaccharovorans TaxID=28210 RepID=A0A2V3U6D3_9HYPH|nr:N-acetyl-D-Glu racemase DgcA [Chelatococcus asaccharovorans]MBS7704205.1 dipeptide epimerase [Chelatococcus asaccharovorans]PXW53167.1 L-alanine-DL-glutamate epimerase-like enolase superfamily enzyme [Chelatococcus asaccharovorans]